MQFLHDGTLHSIWAFCSACRFAGDLIELAAKIFSVSAREMIPTLAQAGIMPRIDLILLMIMEPGMSTFDTESIRSGRPPQRP